jgi:(p)ppGpp synthase/HD superfamily hydrolase
MNAPLLRFARALDFAVRKHAHQRRKGESAEPYINHLAEVTCLLAAATEGRDAVLIVAGLLHDTLEDTETSLDELEGEFGREVAELVAEVSDDTSLPRAERKRLQVAHAATASPRAKMLKIADKTSNLHSLLTSPPKDWSPERRREYFRWAREVVAGCRGANPYLEEEFERVFRRGAAELGIDVGEITPRGAAAR